MKSILFNVTGQTVTRTDDFSVVADSQNYLRAEFAFSDEWTSPICALFGFCGQHYSAILEENSCTVPWEVIKAPGFTVSVVCGDRITANKAVVTVERSGYSDSEESLLPSPDVYTQLINLSEESKRLAQSVRDDADNGVFDGTQGPQGEKGEKGEKGEQGIRGERGYSGLVPKVTSEASGGNITISANTMTVISELTAEATIALDEGVEGYDNEWDFSISQGEVPEQLTLPTIIWGLGISPTFGANSTTLCRLYYIGDTLCGEWVCV